FSCAVYNLSDLYDPCLAWPVEQTNYGVESHSAIFLPNSSPCCTCFDQFCQLRRSPGRRSPTSPSPPANEHLRCATRIPSDVATCGPRGRQYSLRPVRRPLEPHTNHHRRRRF